MLVRNPAIESFSAEMLSLIDEVLEVCDLFGGDRISWLSGGTSVA